MALWPCSAALLLLPGHGRAQQQPGQGTAPATGSLEDAELCCAQGLVSNWFYSLPPVFKSVHLRLHKLLEVDFSEKKHDEKTKKILHK